MEIMKRIYCYDILRGVGIMLVVIIHTISLEWSATFDLADGSIVPSLGLLIAFYVGTMGGLFEYLLGSVLAFTMYKKFIEKKIALNELVIKGIVKGFLLILFHYIFQPLFSYKASIFYHFLNEGIWI